MCTLILGRDVVAPGSVLIAANRDEDPTRPSDPPGLLAERPRLVGGRDRRSGGTWLAVREARSVVAILNRRGDGTGPAVPGRRSRGLLALDVAGVPESAALARALESARAASYAPFTLLFASPEACWLVVLEPGAEPRAEPVRAGWHVITHADLDDAREPRTAGLLHALAGLAPRSVEEAERRLDELLGSHGDASIGLPPVCLHEGRMVTVSASSVWLAPGAARYRHAEGRPCEHPFTDHSHLLRDPASAAGS